MIIFLVVLINVLVVFFAIMCIYLGRVIDRVKGENKDLRTGQRINADLLESALESLVKTEEELKKTKHQKKSSEVRTGLIAENSLGFIKDLPYNFQNMRHLGAPVDYIYFDFDNNEALEIVVVEVKSGNSRESKRQRLIKKAIKENKVFYEKVTVSTEGISVKRS